jgi:vancomycin resistance protein YoaR
MGIKRTFKWIVLIVVVVICGLSVGAMTYIYTKVSEFDKVFAQGVVVSGTDIGGLSRAEAQKKIEAHLVQGLEARNLIIYKGDVSYKIPFSELGSEYNMDEMLDKAYDVGHQGNLLERYKYLRKPENNNISFDLHYIYDKEAIHTVVEAYMPKFHIDPIDATISRENRKFIITPEKEGQELDLVATTENIFNALDDTYTEDIKIEAATKKIPVKYTAESFKDIQNIVASFSTAYNNADANRNVNLKVAAGKINTMLQPGEVFSLAKQLEPISFATGYRNSKVIVNGKLEQGIGGGICQIASTLYNSLLLTNLDITMRQNHSLPVAYVPLGRDATYASDAIDFKFKNSTAYPMFVEGYCENNKVYVNIFAHSSVKSEYDIKFSSVVTEVIPPPAPKYVQDPTLASGTKVEELKALSGKKVKLYKLYYKDGTLVKKELINNSYYRPRGATIKVGTRIIDSPVFNPQIPPLPDANTPVDSDPSINEDVINTPIDESLIPDVIDEVIE